MPDPVQQGEERSRARCAPGEGCNGSGRYCVECDEPTCADAGPCPFCEGVEPRETERWTLAATDSATIAAVAYGPRLCGAETRVVIPAEHLVAERARADAAERERDALKEMLGETLAIGTDLSAAVGFLPVQWASLSLRWRNHRDDVQARVAAMDPSARAQSPDTGRKCSSTGPDDLASERARLREELLKGFEALDTNCLAVFGVTGAWIDGGSFLALVDEVLGGDER